MAFVTRNQYTPSNSSLTVGPFLVGDARTIGLSITSNTSLSPYTVQMTNADGWSVVIPENSWSAVTAIAVQGSYIIEPGLRWLRVLRPESASTVAVEWFTST